MNYQESVDYVHSLPLFSSGRPGLEATGELLRRLGTPQSAFKAVHIAGTNGKGSVAAMVEAVLREAGYTTGLFTSPYLERFTERIRIQGREIGEDEFARVMVRVRAEAEAMVSEGWGYPSFFQLVTAAGFLAFAESNVEWAVVETGMGGRLDQTNVLVPALSVITRIGMDHTEVLGSTLDAIAREKAGIIKPGVPVVVYPQEPEVYAECLAAAKEKEAPLYPADGIRVTLRSWDLSGQCLDVAHQGMVLENLRVSLLGKHQAQNAATALLALTVLAQTQGLRISETVLRQGFAEVKWPGRLEVLRQQPLVLLDGAHNPQGASALAEAVEGILPNGGAVLLCGGLQSKDMDGMVGAFARFAGRVVATEPQHPKAFPAQELAAMFHARHMQAEAKPLLEEALGYAWRLCLDQGLPLVVAGSLYLAGAARSWICAQKEQGGECAKEKTAVCSPKK